MSYRKSSLRAFSLVETMVGLGVMALVITGGLVAIGQAALLSEKSSEQIMADFILRGEAEALRAASWSTLVTHHNAIETYANGNSGKAYPDLITFDAKTLEGMGMSAEVISAKLSSSTEIGKIAFRVLVSWQDRSGRSHDEARVLVITEGGFSADS